MLGTIKQEYFNEDLDKFTLEPFGTWEVCGDEDDFIEYITKNINTLAVQGLTGVQKLDGTIIEEGDLYVA